MNQLYTPTAGVKAITSIPGWASSMLDGTRGDAVTAYMVSAAMMRSVQVRAEAIPTARLALYDADENEIESHAILDLLSFVNADINPNDLWRQTESGWCVYGAAYWELVGDGEPESIFPINPSSMTPLVDARGVRGFRQTRPAMREFAREEVIYFRGVYNPTNDLIGLSPLAFAVHAALGSANADKYLSAFFANGAIPALVLSTPQSMGENAIKSILQWWNKLFRGPDNQHKVGIVGNDLKPVSIGTNPKDLALADVRKELRREIAMATGVPELIITAGDAADQTPTDMAFRILFQTTIAARWRFYEEILNAELLPRYPDLVRSGASLRWDTSQVAAMQEDSKMRADRLALLVEKKIIKPEVAAVELGYTAEDVPGEEAPKPAPTLAPAPIAEAEAPEDVTAEMMSIWRKRALANIGAAVGSPYDAELSNCKNKSDVRALFEAHWPAAPKEQGGMKALADEIKAARMALDAEKPATHIHLPDSLKADFSAALPAPVVNVAAPIVNVTVPDFPAIPAPIVNVAAPNVTVPVTVQPAKVEAPARGARETRIKFETDRNGNITGADAVTEGE